MIIFTHVPKTSGTSFQRSLVDANFASEDIYRYGGMQRFALNRPSRGGGRGAGAGLRPRECAFAWGHMPFGIHALVPGTHQYITFLRDPVDRAISYYHFVRYSHRSKYTHPERNDADILSITEFYARRRYQNWQARFLAGLQYHKLYPYLALESFERATLDKAIHNLTERYFCYGILERFEESIELFQRRFGWDRRAEITPQQTTKSRPALDALDDATRASLEHSNRLDRQLYDAALAHFDSQWSRMALQATA
jgi:tetratricopeptide (TPR) repeat protein